MLAQSPIPFTPQQRNETVAILREATPVFAVGDRSSRAPSRWRLQQAAGESRALITAVGLR